VLDYLVGIGRGFFYKIREAPLRHRAEAILGVGSAKLQKKELRDQGHASAQRSNEQQTNNAAAVDLVSSSLRDLINSPAFTQGAARMSIRITTAAAVLAQMRARQAVKDQLRSKGEKVSHYAARDITRLAEGWLALHGSELMPQCVEQAKAMILSGQLGKRAQRDLRAKLSSDAQTRKSCSNTTFSVQMSGAE
jgi:hypothetical protein